MPEYLPLCAFRQGLLPGECGSCSWWLTTGLTAAQGTASAATRHEWLTDVEREWGHVGLLAHDPDAGRNDERSKDPVIDASIHFAPGSSLPRFRDLPFPPLPPFSALLFCLHVGEDTSHWAAKRLVRRALSELRGRGIDEVYAVAHCYDGGNGHDLDCRFFLAGMLAENGFTEVASNGGLCLMRVDNRGLISLMDQVEAMVRRVFTREEPTPSPAAWTQARKGVGQEVP